MIDVKIGIIIFISIVIIMSLLIYVVFKQIFNKLEPHLNRFAELSEKFEEMENEIEPHERKEDKK